jgi:hypothetical protein
MTRFINLTPHDVVIRFDASNEPISLETDLIFPTQGRGFITTKAEVVLETIDGIASIEIEYGEVEGLGEPVEDTIFIVSMPTAQFLAAQGRTKDIRYPDTGKAEYCIRTAKGQPFATRRLLRAKVQNKRTQ